MLSLVSRAHRGPSAEGFRPEFLLLNGYANTSARWFQSPRWRLGPVCRVCSRHCNPRWRLRAVYREAAHGTAIQDGGWGSCTAKLLRALPSGALSSTTTLDGGELCPLPSLPFSTEETHIKQLHPPACKGSVCTLKQKSHLSIFDRKLNFPLPWNQTWPHFISSRDTREEKPCWE